MTTLDAAATLVTNCNRILNVLSERMAEATKDVLAQLDFHSPQFKATVILLADDTAYLSEELPGATALNDLRMAWLAAADMLDFAEMLYAGLMEAQDKGAQNE